MSDDELDIVTDDFQDDIEDELEEPAELDDEAEADDLTSILEEPSIPSQDLSEFKIKHLDNATIYKSLYGANYRTIPILTKYERTMLLSVRSQQIAEGAPILVDKGKLNNPVDIARKELNEGKLPLLIYRELPSVDPLNKLSEVRRPANLAKLA